MTGGLGHDEEAPGVMRPGPGQSSGAVLAADVGGTRIKAGIVRGGRVTNLVVQTTHGLSDGPGLAQRLVWLCRELASQESIEAIALCLKGIVDPSAGALVAVNEDLAELVGVSLRDMVQGELGLTTFVENDARMYALGELIHGSGRHAQNLVCVTLGTGVGTSVVIARRLLRGERGVLGILSGHLTVDIDGPTCTCGNRGCLEASLGTCGLGRQVRWALATGRASALRDEPTDAEHVFRAARSGDELACELVADFNRRLGAGIVTMIHAYDPDLVVLGGGVLNASEQILPPVQAYVDGHAWTIPRRRVQVVPASLGDTAALVGLAELATHGHAFL